MALTLSFAAAVRRLHNDDDDDDDSLRYVHLAGQVLDDDELAELADCLLRRPAMVVQLNLAVNQLTDQTGVKLARYLAASPVVNWLNLPHNQFGDATYLALAAALRVNTSLRSLALHGNQAVDRARVDAAFVDALRLNPDRPVGSTWTLYSNSGDDFARLKTAADQLGHPPLQALLLLCRLG